MENKQYTVAVIDDELEVLSMIERFLTRGNKYKVQTFSNPLTGIAHIENNFDVVLLDIMMPQMNGLDALEKIMAKNPNQKVIMMTAFSTLDKVLKSHKFGAIHYLMKPFDSLEALERKINEVIKN
jgi:DNA-binding NtrC family response regulator